MTRALRVSEAASLAMHAMGLLASRSGTSLSVKTIAARFQVSEAHLSKVMQRLVKVGLVTSVRGPKGGFSLTRPSDQLTLLEVFEAIEGPMEPTTCLFGVPLCEGDTCILGKVMVEANDLLHDRLANTSLDEVGEFFDEDRTNDSA
jgi:Rrf2 family protein